MSDTYSCQVVTAVLTGTTTDRTKTETAGKAITESFWAEVKLPAAAADTVLKLNLLTDPVALVVISDVAGVSFKLDSTGVDPVHCDPVAVITNETDGLGIDEMLLSNSGAAEATVTIIAAE